MSVPRFFTLGTFMLSFVENAKNLRKQMSKFHMSAIKAPKIWGLDPANATPQMRTADPSIRTTQQAFAVFFPHP